MTDSESRLPGKGSPIEQGESAVSELRSTVEVSSLSDTSALGSGPQSYSADEEQAVSRAGVVGLFGPANAGKSTLVNALLGRKVSIVSPKEQTTRNRILGVLNRPEGQCVFIDTPGFLSKRYRGELCRFINGAITQASQEMDFSVLVVDANRALKESDLAMRLHKSLRDKNIPRPRVIALNKVDLIAKPKLLPCIQGFYDEFNAGDGEHAVTRVLPISARRGDGVEEFIEVVFGLLSPGERYFPDEVSSDQPEAFFVTEIIREKLFRQLNQELPYAIAVQLEGLEERGELLSIGCKIIVESASQRGIVLGKKGSKIKSIGISARKELESVFGMKVDLRLFVKVEKDWTKTQQGMARVGYVKGSTYTVTN